MSIININKILIANRGEIVRRIIQTCKKLQIESVVVYSEADKHLPYIKEATYAYYIGESISDKSYLNQDIILDIAHKEKVDAIHPGYGFLAENAEFAHTVENNGFNFIGPTAEIIETLGNKIQARKTMKSAKIPVIPGSDEPVNEEEAIKISKDIGYPIMLKASAGGGGIGMKRCENEDELREFFVSNQKKAKKNFGSDELFIEKFIKNGRHIEVQIFGDTFGNVVHLFERDCSIQRRNQKIIEETPSPFLSNTSKQKMYKTAIQAVKKLGYYNAGTIEFIVDQEENFYFLEMNTRIQVEHPITEETTGIDMIAWQIYISDEKEIPLNQSEITKKGHAIEFRVCAEDSVSFLPSPGTIQDFSYSEATGIRVDTGYENGSEVSPYYDSLIAKIIIVASDRNKTINKSKIFFDKLNLIGINSNIDLFKKILLNDNFITGNYTTSFLQNYNAKIF